MKGWFCYILMEYNIDILVNRLVSIVGIFVYLLFLCVVVLIRLM